MPANPAQHPPPRPYHEAADLALRDAEEADVAQRVEATAAGAPHHLRAMKEGVEVQQEV